MKTTTSLGIRKGAWTAEEDKLLKGCVEKHGEGKWHQVPLRAVKAHTCIVCNDVVSYLHLHSILLHHHHLLLDCSIEYSPSHLSLTLSQWTSPPPASSLPPSSPLPLPQPSPLCSPQPPAS
ncbi:hypothetical protein ACFE04_009604 [Oxalis oulophora]